MWEVRQQSILKLAPQGMTIAQSETWAFSMTIQGMERRFREAEIWIAEINGAIAGWIAVRGDYIDGLYTDPEFAAQGIGSELLSLAENLMEIRGIDVVRLDSSVNAVNFYLRRGYELTGDPPGNNAIPMSKRLSFKGI
jgi:putative acetyltransferase